MSKLYDGLIPVGTKSNAILSMSKLYDGLIRVGTKSNAILSMSKLYDGLIRVGTKSNAILSMSKLYDGLIRVGTIPFTTEILTHICSCHNFSPFLLCRYFYYQFVAYCVLMMWNVSIGTFSYKIYPNTQGSPNWNTYNSKRCELSPPNWCCGFLQA